MVYQGLCFPKLTAPVDLTAVTFLQTKRLSFKAASYQLVYLVGFEWEENGFMKTIEGESYLMCSE